MNIRYPIYEGVYRILTLYDGGNGETGSDAVDGEVRGKYRTGYQTTGGK